MEYFSKDGVHLWILISSENTIGISGLKTAPDLKDSLHILRGGGGEQKQKNPRKKTEMQILQCWGNYQQNWCHRKKGAGATLSYFCLKKGI